jgi:hypothetical protein
MTIDVPGFRAAFPVFADTTKFSDSEVTFWLNQAYATYTIDTFGAQLDMAAMLFTAHFIVLSARDQALVALGGIPGAPPGIASSKSVGPASISYDLNLTSSAGAGIWNATSYGQRLYAIIRGLATFRYFPPARPRRYPWR